jgi:hypothetical protein
VKVAAFAAEELLVGIVRNMEKKSRLDQMIAQADIFLKFNKSCSGEPVRASKQSD